jgi:hypothetical protein
MRPERDDGLDSVSAHTGDDFHIAMTLGEVMKLKRLTAIGLILGGALSLLTLLPLRRFALAKQDKWTVSLDWPRGDTYLVLCSMDGRIAIAISLTAVIVGAAMFGSSLRKKGRNPPAA